MGQQRFVAHSCFPKCQIFAKCLSLVLFLLVLLLSNRQTMTANFKQRKWYSDDVIRRRGEGERGQLGNEGGDKWDVIVMEMSIWIANTCRTSTDAVVPSPSMATPAWHLANCGTVFRLPKYCHPARSYRVTCAIECQSTTVTSPVKSRQYHLQGLLPPSLVPQSDSIAILLFIAFKCYVSPT